MAHATPCPLPQSRDLAFLGERVRREAIVSSREAAQLLVAQNAHGKPNSDVMRRLIGADAIEHWIVDFPPGWTAEEARLYEAPFAWLGERLAASEMRFWESPFAQPALRTALARRERFLAAPPDEELAWDWLDSELLPDESLLVVARDDDFAHGLLSSRWFRQWWNAFRDPSVPERSIQSFPFPWPPEGRGVLSRAQEDAKFALSRAVRADDQDAIDAAAATCYGWPGAPTDDFAMDELLALHAKRRDQI
jgi:hypothetical protein